MLGRRLAKTSMIKEMPQLQPLHTSHIFLVKNVHKWNLNFQLVWFYSSIPNRCWKPDPVWFLNSSLLETRGLTLYKNRKRNQELLQFKMISCSWYQMHLWVNVQDQLGQRCWRNANCPSSLLHNTGIPTAETEHRSERRAQDSFQQVVRFSALGTTSTDQGAKKGKMMMKSVVW